MKLFSEYDDDYAKYLSRLPVKVKMRIDTASKHRQYGFHVSAPVTCSGPEDCLFIKHCPIAEKTEDGIILHGDIANYPVNQPCIVEAIYIRQKIIDYMTQLGVEENNALEMAIVNELALLDLFKNRCLMILSGGDKKEMGRDLMITQISVGKDGVSENYQMHPLAIYMDNLEKRRERWMDSLEETRKAKTSKRLKQGQMVRDNGVLSLLSDLRESMQQQWAQPLLEGVIQIDD